MYELLKRLVCPLLKVEAAEAVPPAGRHDSFQVFRASPAFLRYKLFFWKLYVAAWSLGVIVASAVLVAISGWFVLLVIPLIVVALFKAAVFYVATRLNYDMRWYVVTDRSLLIREGIWTVREITLTFANAQNVRIGQGPLERFFGFSNIEVDTAGGGGGGKGEGTKPHRAVLRGLDDAVMVRQVILEHLRRYRTAGLGDADDHSANQRTLNSALLGEILDEARKLHQTLAKATQ